MFCSSGQGTVKYKSSKLCHFLRQFILQIAQECAVSWDIAHIFKYNHKWETTLSGIASILIVLGNAC